MSRLKKNAGLDNNLVNEINKLLISATAEMLQEKGIQVAEPSFDLYDLLSKEDVDEIKIQLTTMVNKIKEAVENIESEDIIE